MTDQDFEIPTQFDTKETSSHSQSPLARLVKRKSFFSLRENSLMDDESFDISLFHSTAAGGKKEEQEVLARRETKAVKGLRMFVIVVLTSVAICVSVAAYVLISKNETSNFETAFADQATLVIDAFQINAKQQVGAIESFSMSITSHAKFTNSTWPFVTVPDFERRGEAASKLAEVMSMVMVPMVTDEQRAEWEEYAVENQGWFQEGLDGSNGGEQNSIPEEIYSVEGSTTVSERGPGPYLPQWQIAPIVPLPALVNFNLLSHAGLKDSLNALLEAEVAVVSRSFDFSDPNDEATAGRRDVFNYFIQDWEEDNAFAGETNTFDNDPIADLHVPLYDDFNEDKRNLVGLLTCVVYWRTYFVDILAENTNGITVVLANTCDQEYTYVINGPSVEYVGPGDQHDPAYTSQGRSTKNGADLQVDDESRNIDGSCLYSVHVYPSYDFEEPFITNKPAVYTAIMVFIFIFTSAVFLIYDCLVERRQRVVMDTAVASSAIVSSLFPKVVRERLYLKEKDDKKDFAGNDSVPQQSFQNYVLSNSNLNNPDNQPAAGKPIADLFENCTVLFADISGFTAWSSNREPTQVFTLLESLYGAFDKIAKKRHVFKVETIGDCYLAVTGLPDPQTNHAMIMCLFAHECMRKMNLIMGTELRGVLADATELSMRFGLHSGPVTGGVLRGKKSRFQLFGDTVNTAARMESTGQRDKIQLSQQTADLLVQGGKGNWIDERADMVQAKGKGQLQTYWLRVKSGRDMTAPNRDSKQPEDMDQLKFHGLSDHAPRGLRPQISDEDLDDSSYHSSDTNSYSDGLYDSNRSLTAKTELDLTSAVEETDVCIGHV